MDSRPKIYFLVPLFLALALIIGYFLGKVLVPDSRPIIYMNDTRKGVNKLNEVINFINEAYVDTINPKELSEETINAMLQNLDPHSYYIPASDFTAVSEPLEGNFDGIGIEFRIITDTVVVINTIQGGPSEEVGLLAGDRIVIVDSTKIAGRQIENKDVIDKLKGPRGTKVKVKVFRKGAKDLLDFTITRNRIPIYSINVSYMLDDEIGYVRINRFARNTYAEFVEATNKLQDQGMKKLIVDLRGNGGGYLQAATDIADEFLAKNKLVVYTEGKARPRSAYYATGSGNLENIPLAVLINENSASASEILAGAIQDNDRGVIVGRRSFGKGLVQEQMRWPDGSAIRLTVARYYTPTGRCIQKSYAKGIESYHEEAYKRLERGELTTPDSIKFPDSLKYVTPKGKVVYGGGGIMPDVFVPIDTSGSDYLNRILFNGIFQQFAFDYVDKHKKDEKYFTLQDMFMQKFSVNKLLLNNFFSFAEEKGVPFDEHGYQKTKDYFHLRLKASIARYLFGENGYFMVMDDRDRTLGKAMDAIK